jgi:hypothetical protein
MIGTLIAAAVAKAAITPMIAAKITAAGIASGVLVYKAVKPNRRKP